jgi:hypothetical protein
MSIYEGYVFGDGAIVEGGNFGNKIYTTSTKGFQFCTKKNLNVTSMIKIQNRD